MNYDFFVKKKSVQEQLQFLYDNNKTEFNKFYASQQKKKLTYADLEHWFVDSEGKTYYRFPKQMSLPLLRKGEMDSYYQFMASGLSGKEHLDIIEAEEKILAEGVGKPEVVGKLGALIHLKKQRLKLIFHSELYLNIVAVQAIREDEQPDTFNNQIQMEKVIQFKKEVELKNAYFFFQEIQFESPIDLLRYSQAELVTLWDESQIQIQNLPEILKLLTEFRKDLTSSKKSKQEKKTSQNS